MAFSFLPKRRANEFILIRTYSFARLSRYLQKLILFVYRFSQFHLSTFAIQLCYFLSLDFLGSLLLTLLKPSNPAFTPRYVDMLFMSTSALTVSGLGTVVMEDLSSAQIVVLMLLMLFGGDVFVTLLGLLFRRSKQEKPEASLGRVDNIELEPVDVVDPTSQLDPIDRIESGIDFTVVDSVSMADEKVVDLRRRCVRYLGYVVSAYVAIFHLFGTSLLVLYFYRVSSARGILNTKGINVFLFSLSSTVSSFANGGLIATNENMAIFNKDPIILLLMIGQVLGGNLLFPLFLRCVIWALKKLTKKEEFEYMLENSGEKRLRPLLPGLQTSLLSLTAMGLMTMLLVVFCSMDWNGAVFDGLNPFQKIVSALFIAANSRHAGENSIDCSLISPAVLVFLVVMMYLPSSTSFSPIQEEDDTSSDHEIKQEKNKKKSWVQSLLLSQLSCIIIFIIIICITERKKLSRDPINFSTLNIIFEVTSGYGNVGLSTGYSCSRLQRVNPDAICEDKPYSLSGWWSDEGKLILALVMLYGRLKKFSAKSGKAWKLY